MSGAPHDLMEEGWLRDHLEHAVRLAVDNARVGQLPYGAVVLHHGEVVATGVNTALADDDPTAHAEVVALRAACRALGTLDLPGAIVAASCEPCVMCQAACATAGITHLVYAAPTEWVPDLDGRDRTVTRAMQAALRDLRPGDVRHVETPGADLPFTVFLDQRGDSPPSP